MKTLLKTFAFVVLLLAFFSCNKTSTATITKNASESTENNLNTSCTSRWLGIYLEGNSGTSTDTVQDIDFISKGKASLKQSPWSYYYSRIQLKIPSCRNISGDSAALKVRLRNNGSAVGAVFPYDVSLWMEGAYNTAHVQFLSYYVQFTALTVGTAGKTGDSSLLHQFDDWSIVTLSAKDNRLSVYVNDTLVKKINYTGSAIGELKSIFLFFKGPGEIDWVKLYSYSAASSKSSPNRTLKMSEDFNIDGTSSVVWY